MIAEEDLLAFCRESAIEYFPGCARRQITTRGVDLESLIGATFRIGDAICVGVEPCHPYRSLAESWTPQVLPGLVGRGGLRAGIISGGNIRVGAEIFRLKSGELTLESGQAKAKTAIR